MKQWWSVGLDPTCAVYSVLCLSAVFRQFKAAVFGGAGNHDIPLYHVWNGFFSPFARYQLFFGGDGRDTLETEHFYVIGVSSIRRRYHTRGHISLSQIQEIDPEVAASTCIQN